MNEIIFLVTEAPEGGYVARALGESIFTEADDLTELHERVRDAVRCHFDLTPTPNVIRLHFTRKKSLRREASAGPFRRRARSATRGVGLSDLTPVRKSYSSYLQPPTQHHVTVPAHGALRVGRSRRSLTISRLITS